MNSGNGSAYAVSFKSSFGLSGWLYLLFCLILIALGAIEHFKLNVTEESIKKILKKILMNSKRKKTEFILTRRYYQQRVTEESIFLSCK